VDLEDPDRARLIQQGLSAADRLPLPCPHFIAPACSIYAIRPSGCSDYQCEVLKGLLGGRIERKEAQDLVDQARRMRRLVEEALPDGLTAVRLAQDVRAQAPENRTPARLAALARFVAYRLFVERNFLGPRSRWMTGAKRSVEGSANACDPSPLL
jgi:hypothetical protein